MKSRTLATVWLMTLASGGAGPPSFVRQPAAARVEAPAVTEASGLAVSQRDADHLWLLNDSGHAPVLHLATTVGTERGSLVVEGVPNRDWEALDSFRWNGKAYLLVADVGDNDAVHEHCAIHVLPEPELPEGAASLPRSVKPEWTIRFRYEDGPRDCESVAVDVAAGKILLLSKRTVPPVLYELPLRPEKAGIASARRIGETDVRPPPGGLPHPYGAQPTGLAISPDGSLAAVLTYVTVFLFPRTDGESWADAFSRKPVELHRHGLMQAEAITFSKDGAALFVVSEGRGSKIARYDRQPAGAE